MKYLSLFSGVGGFELGIKQAYEKLQNGESSGGLGQEESLSERFMSDSSSQSDKRQHPSCIGFSEIDKYAIQVYNKHFNHKNYGDITKINARELEDFELLVGGFPCQTFSIAGKRAGFNDTRGTLFFEIARIIREKQPRLLLLENVKGLLSHEQGRTFYTIISTLDELGYDCQWQVLNSKNFGVPQNRERVFIIGHLRGTSRPEVFPIGGDGEETNAELQELTQGVSDAMRIYNVGRVCKGISGQVDNPKGIARTLKGLGGGLGAKTGLYAVPVITPDRPKKRQNGRRFKENGEPAFTVTAQDRHGIYDGAKIRKLTPKECERLQGFPDDWTKYGITEKENAVIVDNKLYTKPEEIKISDTQRYKMCGNAVTVNVVKEIIKRLI